MILWEQIYQIFLSRMKVRYRDTFLGIVWALLYPLGISLVLYLVFSKIGRFGVDNYFIYLFSALIVWRFFSSFTSESITILLSSREVLRKTSLNRMVPVLSLLLYHTVNHLIEYIILIVFGLFLGMDFGLWFLFPVILVLEILLVSGIGLILSALYLFFTDILHIWQFMLQLLFFLSPIFYPLSLIPQKYMDLYMLNPITLLVVYQRNILVYGKFSDYTHFVYLIIWSLFIFLLGLFIFKKLENPVNKLL